MLKLVTFLAALFVSQSALALTAKQTAKIFEEARIGLPCVNDIARVAQKSGMKLTARNTKTGDYQDWEFADRKKKAYLLVSHETRGGNLQRAISVSVYNTNDNFPPNLTNAFADYWDLPVPTPIRTNPDLAQLEWQIGFPNGPMQVIVSYDSQSGLTQIYGRTIDLRKDQLNGCSN